MKATRAMLLCRVALCGGIYELVLFSTANLADWPGSLRGTVETHAMAARSVPSFCFRPARRQQRRSSQHVRRQRHPAESVLGLSPPPLRG
ncbi:uncharacterized protein LAESUDRAFT_363232 [Laetiporus sulphureus 93-53]|uniref:Uncharacterized protein n=1 Tax=Laetiporus sulphureus 93-53 TaxID=1314785 RepID=A0A165GZZ3_9APHY|nr:uncharacterized protein LAESUDRAFT_363232 [Laetiporus sulphureus 93-53]KZT11059.1 hypothetical protein LAESUDRAFT_363232 [Laetiporus sulphureus 93-53]